MNYTNLKILVTISLMVSAPSVYSQFAPAKNAFIDDTAYLLKFEKDGVKRNNCISAEQAQQQLLSVLDKKVELKKVRPAEYVLTSEQIAEKAKQSTVVIGETYHCGNCAKTHVGIASGYVIGEDGVIVTNYHVVDGYASEPKGKLSFRVMTASGDLLPVTEILSCSPDKDLAVIKVETGGKKLIPFSLGESASQGSDIFVMSHPSEMFYFFSKGIVARNYLKQVKPDSALTYPEMEITADYAAGSSGGPVLDNKGNVVGTVSTTSSVYYHPEQQKDLQMVVKGTKPVVSLKDLLILK